MQIYKANSDFELILIVISVEQKNSLAQVELKNFRMNFRMRPFLLYDVKVRFLIVT